MGMMKKRRDEDNGNLLSMIKSCIPFNLAKRSRFRGGLDTSHGVTWLRRHKLGQGGFASVYSATSRTTSPVVFVDDNGATCIMPSELAVKSAEISKSSSLRIEMEILCDLNSSSYVVRCYGDEITTLGDGKLYYNILLEKCCGGSLRWWITNSGGAGLPEDDVRRYTRDIVRGLCYIHGRGYAHCDIKPDNILLVPTTCCNGFRAKIGDFGSAKKAYFEAEDEKEYGEGRRRLRGTYRYMSPELVAHEMRGCLSDIWALGCVVIEMMSGRLVWSRGQHDSDIRDVLVRIGFSRELPEFPSNISKEGRHFLERCLDRDIDERWSALMLLQHPFLSPSQES